jgi:hypothetical protein
LTTHKAMKWLIKVTLIITACAIASALFVDVRPQSAKAAANRAKLQRVLRAAREARR